MDAEVINKAIAAHGQWKIKLKDAIAKDGDGLDPAAISRDNACEFGKWLYSTPAFGGHFADHANVKKLHADFHRAASEVAQLAKAKRRTDAEKLMNVGGKYFDASANLVTALMNWKKKV